MRVSLFVTCLVDQVRPSVGMATVELLERLGCEVIFNPEQTCCGQPAYTTGNRREAIHVAKHTLKVLEAERVDWVVMPSGSCAAMFHHYAELLEDSEWRDRALAVIRRTHELSSFLVKVLGVTDVGAEFTGRITWHDACHGFRDLGVSEEPRTLLRNVRGLELMEMEHCAACCGFGGVFSISYPDVSTAMADRKLDEILRHNLDAIVSGDVGCLMQLGDRLMERGCSLPTLHIAELLAQRA